MTSSIMFFSPLEQFIIITPSIFQQNLYLSNASYNILFIYMLIALILSTCTGVTKISFLQFIIFKLFTLVKDVAIQNIKIKNQAYILHLFITFLFILLANIIGLFPYSFSLTSHFSVTFFISYSFFVSIVLIGLKKNGLFFFKIFLPVKVPIFIAPILICVEIVSFIIRPLSMAVRLSANMLAGHVLLKILSLISWTMLFSGNLFLMVLFFIPFSLLFLIMLLELMVSFLQAYVFLVLMTIYLNEVINI